MKTIQMVAAMWVLTAATAALAAESEGKVLFDGKDASGWQNDRGGAPSSSWVIEDGALTRKEKAGNVWTKERYGDFLLELEYKTAGNSGIFIRTGSPRDCVQTGIEIAIDTPSREPGRHSTGALYDLVAPTKVADRPAGEWNQVAIRAQGGKISVVLNGEPVVDADVDLWTEAGKNPDGSPNKFRAALKDFPREGHIGFQDHGAFVAFRNVRIRAL